VLCSSPPLELFDRREDLAPYRGRPSVAFPKEEIHAPGGKSRCLLSVLLDDQFGGSVSIQFGDLLPGALGASAPSRTRPYPLRIPHGEHNVPPRRFIPCRGASGILDRP
jgi:hypothetical protein